MVEKSPSRPSTPPRALERDYTCLGCGYNLRGQPERGSCPECGLPVAKSRLGDLREQPAAYLRRVKLGLALVLTGYLCWLGALVAMLPFAAGMNLVNDNEWVAAIVCLLSGLVLAACVLWGLAGPSLGWWVATSRQPESASMLGRGLVERRAVRVLTPILACSVLVTIVSVVRDIAAGGRQGDLFIASGTVLSILWYLLVILGQRLLNQWAWSMAERHQLRIGRTTSQLLVAAPVLVVYSQIVEPLVRPWLPYPVVGVYLDVGAIVLLIVALACHVMCLREVQTIVKHAHHDAAQREGRGDHHA